MQHLNTQGMELNKAKRAHVEVAEKYNDISATQRQAEIEIARMCEIELKQRQDNISQ